MKVKVVATGVGFRVFNRDISQLPSLVSKNLVEVKYEEYNALPKEAREEETYISQKGNIYNVEVGDSRKGWIDALMFYLEQVTSKQKEPVKLIYNFDSVRPFGERILGFGGTASGPQALKELVQDVVRIIQEIPFDRFRSIDCMDISCAIAKGVIAGNSRRSALLCMFDEGDELCANAKTDLYSNPDMVHKYYRSQSNNTECIGSIHYEEFLDWLKLHPNATEEEVIHYLDWFTPSKKELEKRLQTVKYLGEPGFDHYLMMVYKRYKAAKENRAERNPFNYVDVASNP